MRTFIVGTLLSLAILVTAGGVNAQESPLIGTVAPDFTLELLSGKPASMSELVKDGKAILFFFATWCPHCREQLKAIHEQKAEMEKDQINVLLVDIGESKATLSKFLSSRNIDSDAFLDTDSFVANIYQVMGVPTLVFIGKDRKIRLVEYGLPEDYRKILE